MSMKLIVIVTIVISVVCLHISPRHINTARTNLKLVGKHFNKMHCVHYPNMSECNGTKMRGIQMSTSVETTTTTTTATMINTISTIPVSIVSTSVGINALMLQNLATRE